VLLPPYLQFRENLSIGGQKPTFIITPKLKLVGEIEERNPALMLARPV
jgi:hypothetical protein